MGAGETAVVAFQGSEHRPLGCWGLVLGPPSAVRIEEHTPFWPRKSFKEDIILHRASLLTQ